MPPAACTRNVAMSAHTNNLLTEVVRRNPPSTLVSLVPFCRGRFPSSSSLPISISSAKQSERAEGARNICASLAKVMYAKAFTQSGARRKRSVCPTE